MDKFLAMSILGAAPANIFGPSMISIKAFKNTGREGSWKKSEDDDLAKQAKEKKQMPPPSQKRSSVWFDPSLDGLNCFETLVSH